MRLLSMLCLCRTGYDFKRLFTISEYYDRDRPAFYRAIQSVRERGMDMTGWLEYFVEGLSTQLAEVKQRGERAIQRDVLVRKHGLSDRQALALGHVLEHGRLLNAMAGISALPIPNAWTTSTASQVSGHQYQFASGIDRFLYR